MNEDAPRGGKAAFVAGCPAPHNCQALQTEENEAGNLKHQGRPTAPLPAFSYPLPLPLPLVFQSHCPPRSLRHPSWRHTNLGRVFRLNRNHSWIVLQRVPRTGGKWPQQLHTTTPDSQHRAEHHAAPERAISSVCKHEAVADSWTHTIKFGITWTKPKHQDYCHS